jgi:hypothetical protein
MLQRYNPCFKGICVNDTFSLKKQTVADLSKDWDEDNDDAASAGDAEETIESIVNFIQVISLKVSFPRFL